uniref:Uncharacterized protein n=1 Tax=Anguilla anguilla TaxID=7936 RepID=A0A0E9VUB1_ANGAN
MLIVFLWFCHTLCKPTHSLTHTCTRASIHSFSEGSLFWLDEC